MRPHAQPHAEPELHIASLVVHATSKRAPGIAAGLEALPGAQVHAVSDTGKLVVTLEADTTDAMLAQIGQIQRLPGVLSATVVYQCIDSLDAMNELMPEEGAPEESVPQEMMPTEEVPDGHRPS